MTEHLGSATHPEGATPPVQADELIWPLVDALQETRRVVALAYDYDPAFVMKVSPEVMKTLQLAYDAIMAGEEYLADSAAHPSKASAGRRRK